MGGQACVFYGAAEFSRDCDIAILCDDQNIERLRSALIDLAAEPIAVPPFQVEFLERGHAIHFRCQAEGAQGMRLDVMSRMRGVSPFRELWSRRTTLEDDSGTQLQIMGLSDLIAAKTTQRDKDWPMIRRLVEANYVRFHDQPTEERVTFWLRHARSPQIIQNLAAGHPLIAHELGRERPLLRDVLTKSTDDIERSLMEEERLEREADRRYWQPLKSELETMRRQRPRSQ
jgi:hypothetical protein